jgi:diguanylate cyclase (GGDEF)-like protein/PAS domain S-box-containing protein
MSNLDYLLEQCCHELKLESASEPVPAGVPEHSGILKPQMTPSQSPTLWLEAAWGQTTLQLMNDGVVITDAEGIVLFLNPAAEKLTGYRADTLQGQCFSTKFQFLSESTGEVLADPIATSLTMVERYSNPAPVLLSGQREDLALISYNAISIRDQHQHLIGAALVFWDVNKHSASHSEFSWQVNHDTLTGLMNRYSFEQYLERAIASAKCLGQQHVLCYLDVDRFKVINDTCGHVAGDEFLRRISTILQQRVRKSDILARLGSNEFGLIFYQCNLEQAMTVIDQLRQAVHEFRFVWEEQVFSFSVSAGIVVLNTDTESASGALIAADSACTMAKLKGRDRVHVYQSNDLDVATQRDEIQWVPRLFRALEEDQFVLYAQPIISVGADSCTNQEAPVHYYEVLLRLRDQNGQIISPGAFLPAAERFGLMHLIDRWVVRNLFSYLSATRWANSTSTQEICPEHSYTINLSGASLNDDQFLEFVQQQFAIHAVPPGIICFEITETVAISNLDKAIHFIEQLKKLGCHFALDDFGSGMSSFGYLKNLPVDYLKIDGIFIKEIVSNDVACEIVDAINRIAHVMGIQTVAEYVENQDIFQKLKNFAIDYAQGYGISEPLPLFSF